MRVFTVIGPTQSGKSTLVDALSSLDGRASRFDISGVVNLRSFEYLGEPWMAIDIDGGADSLAYAGPAVAVSDAVVLCVPPDPDAAVLSAPYLRLVEQSGVPCFLFINRMDNPNGRIRDIVAGLQSYARHHITLRQIPIREGDTIVGAVDLISERAWKYREGEPSALIELPQSAEQREQAARAELLEELSDHDDHLLEQLIEDKQPPSEEIYHLAAEVLQHHELIPAYIGAAGHGNGLRRLMKALRHEAPGVEVARDRAGAGQDVLAIAAFADIKKHIGKLVVLRALGEGLKPHDQLGGGSIGSLTAIDAKTQLDGLKAGEIGLAVKSDHLNPGLLLTAMGGAEFPRWAAARPAGFRQVVRPVHERDDVRLSSALSRLSEIDPGMSLSQDELSGHAVVGTQGPLHIRRITEKLESDFSLEITADPVQAEYRESITKTVEHRHRHRKQSGGAGQFADVVIEIAPLPRGSGFEFAEVVKGGAVPRNYIPAVENGAADALSEGPKGHPVVDLKVTLKDGKHHSVDSSDFAFRTAGKMAVRDAILQAGPILLQPVTKVEIHLPSVFVGELVPTISSLHGQVLGFAGHPDVEGWDVFNALLPAVTQDELNRALASSTRGAGWAEFTFDHYEEVRGPIPEAAQRGNMASA
ncbi:MAG: elongation factor G [Jhaorihella sp.]